MHSNPRVSLFHMCGHNKIEGRVQHPQKFWTSFIQALSHATLLHSLSLSRMGRAEWSVPSVCSVDCHSGRQQRRLCQLCVIRTNIRTVHGPSTPPSSLNRGGRGRGGYGAQRQMGGRTAARMVFGNVECSVLGWVGWAGARGFYIELISYHLTSVIYQS